MEETLHSSLAEPPSCLELTSPDSGRVVFTGTTPGSIATYSCMPGYVLVGDKIRTCQENGEWTGIAPFCRRKSFRLIFFFSL